MGNCLNEHKSEAMNSSRFKKKTVKLAIISFFELILAVMILAVLLQNYNRLQDMSYLTPSLIKAGSQPTEDGTAKPSKREGTILLDIEEGRFIAISPSLPLLGEERDALVVELPKGDYPLVYDMEEGYLSFSINEEHIVVRNVSANDIEIDSIYEFMDDENNLIITAQKKVTENAGVSIVAAIQNKEHTESVLDTITEIYQNVYMHNGNTKLQILDLTFSPAWSYRIVLDNSVIGIKNGEELITISPYLHSLTGAGFTDELKINDIYSFLYGSYQEKESGYRPYMYTDDAGTLKIMATGEEALSSALKI